MERPRKYERDAVLTRANAVTGARLLLSLNTIKDLTREKKPTWKTLVKHVAASVGDHVDGRFAREDGSTESGEFLDPLVDKIQIIGQLEALAKNDRVSRLPVLIIETREAVATWRRVKLKKMGFSLPSKPLGKKKTVAEQVAIGIALTPGLGERKLLVNASLWIAAGLAVVSGIDLLAEEVSLRRALQTQPNVKA